MAYTRSSDTTKSDQNTQLLGDGLDAFISGQISTYQQQVKVQDNKDESSFQALVAAGNMTLDQQLAYRQAQIGRTLDSDTRSQIKTSISTLKAQIAQKTFSDSYTKTLQDHAAGITSIDSVISWLQDQLTSATDTAVIDSINKELVTQQGARFTAVQNMLKDQTDYAKNSGDSTVISNQLTALSSAKAKALLGGDNETAANLDLQIQSLNQFQAEQSVKNTLQNIAVATISGAASATNQLDAYNAQIAGADSTTPITVNGTTYTSAQAFWSFTRDQYLADTTPSGFFPQISTETKNLIAVKSSNNTLSSADIAAMNAKFAGLGARPELGAFTAQLAVAQQDTIQSAANDLSTVIKNKYTNDLDLPSAVNALNALKAQGVNVDSAMQDILNSASALKSTNIENIIKGAQDIMSASPGTSITDAVTQAIQKGAGVVLSPNTLLASNPQQIAADQLAKNKAGTNVQDTNTTLPKTPAAGTAPTSAAQGQDVGSSYTIKYGDTLGAIASAHGTTVAAIAAANNIVDPNKIQAGATLKIPGAATPTAPAVPKPATPVTPSGTSNIDFTLHANETIAQYNSRIAAAEAAEYAKNNPPAPAAPAQNSPTPSQPSPASTPSTGTGNASTPSQLTPAPAANSPAAPNYITYSGGYVTSSFLSQNKLTESQTNGGGSAYKDPNGNLYINTGSALQLRNDLR